jgi:hypothetical protein
MLRMNHLTEKQRQEIIDNVVDQIAKPKNKIRIVRDEAALGICVEANVPAGCLTTILVTPENGSNFHVKGVRSLNVPGEIEIVRIADSTGDIAFNAGPFDSASYSLDVPSNLAKLAEHNGYYEVPWGAITGENPIMITFRSLGTPAMSPYLRWTLFGTKTSEVATGESRETGSALSRQRRRDAMDEVADKRLAEEPRSAIRQYPALPREDRPSPHPWGIPRR